MKHTHRYYGRLLPIVLLITFFAVQSRQALAQKVLDEQETRLVFEAQNELYKALSDPDMELNERTILVERSAKTLKELGQPSGFPSGDIPLKEFIQANFDKASKQYNDANALRQDLAKMQLDAKMKFINALQIEVVEEQVKLLVPGKAPIELSSDLVGTVFNWNIAEGVNGGKVDDAQDLVEIFRQSAKANKLSGQLDKLFNDHKLNVNDLNRDLKMMDPIEAQLRKKYEIAAASTFTRRGYEGALLPGSEPAAAGSSQTVSNLRLDPALYGTWLNTDTFKKKSGWQFNTDGSAVQYIRDEKIPGWKWEVKAGMLYIIGGNGKSEDYAYKIEYNKLYMQVTLLGEQVWSAPMSKM